MGTAVGIGLVIAGIILACSFVLAIIEQEGAILGGGFIIALIIAFLSALIQQGIDYNENIDNTKKICNNQIVCYQREMVESVKASASGPDRRYVGESDSSVCGCIDEFVLKGNK